MNYKSEEIKPLEVKNPLKQLEWKKKSFKVIPITGEKKVIWSDPPLVAKKMTWSFPHWGWKKFIWIDPHWGEMTHHQQWKESD
jgi:hypothetical protein